MSEEITKPVIKRKKSTIISDKVVKPKADKTRHYVDNVLFFETLIKWQAATEKAELEGTQKPKIPEFIGECILKICTRLSTLHYFCGYTYVDELVNNAIENCIKKLRNFDLKKTSNPFAYFTQIAYYSFLGTIEHEKEEAYVKYKSIIQCLSSAELANNSEDMSTIAEHSLDNVELQIGHLEEYVKNFEDKKLSKKAAAKKPTPIDDIFGTPKKGKKKE